MGERFAPPPEEMADWRPEPKDHYSNKGAHKARHDFWHEVAKVENAVNSVQALPSPTENSIKRGILEPRILKRGGQ